MRNNLIVTGVASASLTAIVFVSYIVFSIVTFTMPIRYVAPFEVDHRFYKAGGTLLVTVEYCLHEDIASYNITQYFVNEDTGDQYFTTPLNDLTLLRASITSRTDMYFTEKDGTASKSPSAYWSCRKVIGVPKPIPMNIPDGTYRMYFNGSLRSFFGGEKIVRYSSEPFIIQSKPLYGSPKE